MSHSEKFRVFHRVSWQIPSNELWLFPIKSLSAHYSWLSKHVIWHCIICGVKSASQYKLALSLQLQPISGTDWLTDGVYILLRRYVEGIVPFIHGHIDPTVHTLFHSSIHMHMHIPVSIHLYLIYISTYVSMCMSVCIYEYLCTYITYISTSLPLLLYE